MTLQERAAALIRKNFVLHLNDDGEVDEIELRAVVNYSRALVEAAVQMATDEYDADSCMCSDYIAERIRRELLGDL